MRLSLTLSAVLFAVACTPFAASGQALANFSGGSLFATYNADGDTVGWRFSVNRPIVVTHLGFWDGDSATQPITTPHAVGLWDNAGSLLTTTSVTPASPLTGQFRYAPSPAVVIAAGTYNLGAFYAADATIADGYLTGTTGITMASGFTMLNTLRDPDGAATGLAYPSVVTAPGGRFGPNILFTEVPEPASFAALTLLGTVSGRRRR